jgi:hypothetical protein
VQCEKALSPRHLTEAGREIDCNEEHWWSAEVPISWSVDWGSKFNDLSDVHP